jgi:hypothetical protein
MPVIKQRVKDYLQQSMPGFGTGDEKIEIVGRITS